MDSALHAIFPVGGCDKFVTFNAQAVQSFGRSFGILMSINIACCMSSVRLLPLYKLDCILYHVKAVFLKF